MRRTELSKRRFLFEGRTGTDSPFWIIIFKFVRRMPIKSLRERERSGGELELF